VTESSSLPYPPGAWTPIEADASARTYSSGRFEGTGALLAEFGDDLDGRERFLFTTHLLEGAGLRVPRLLHAPEGASWLLVERIDGIPLSAARGRPVSEGRLLRLAGAIQDIGGWEGGPVLFGLDGPRLRFECTFFSAHFWAGYLNRPPDAELDEALRALAAAVSLEPPLFCHRDLHSENLLLERDGGLVIIDHQDALMGPPAYDAASLAVDAYRPYSGRRYYDFAEAWLSGRSFGPEAFHRTALQRALKALGTFGYQVIRRKKVRYLGAMETTARYVLLLLKHAPSPLGSLREAMESLLDTH